MKALQAATLNAAECAGKLDSLGTIEEGKIADLILLEANPLLSIENTKRITSVFYNGKQNRGNQSAKSKLISPTFFN
jgi:imidazolonepropionase-like amidohydrolase